MEFSEKLITCAAQLFDRQEYSKETLSKYPLLY